MRLFRRRQSGQRHTVVISLDEKTHKYAQAVAQHRQIDVSAALLLLVQEGIKRIAHRRINTGNQEVTIKLDRADLEAVTAMAQERGIEIPEAVCILVKRALLRKANPPGV